MINWTELDRLRTAHELRVARVNREGWWRTVPMKAARPHGSQAVVTTGEPTVRRPRVDIRSFIPALLRRAAI